MVQDDLVCFWQVPGHLLMLELVDRLVKDVRAYAYATKESWIIAMGQEKMRPAALNFSYRCFGSCPVELTGVVPRA